MIKPPNEPLKPHVPSPEVEPDAPDRDPEIYPQRSPQIEPEREHYTEIEPGRPDANPEIYPQRSPQIEPDPQIPEIPPNNEEG